MVNNSICRQYAAIVFLTKNQFEICKRKLNYLTFDDLIYCANQMTKNWSIHINNNNENEYDDVSKDFLINLKDLKIFIEKEVLDDHKKLVITSITKFVNTSSNKDIKLQKDIKMLDNSFKVIYLNV